MGTKFWTSIAACTLILIAVLCAAPLIGSAPIHYGRALAGLAPDSVILFYARLPRVLLALLAGGTLGVAGVLFQALLRDALATPYTLGISSGASLGAVLAICLGLREIGGLPGVWVCAFAGAALVLLLVLGIASEGRRMSSFTLLLAGITINSICLAVILFLQNIASFGQSFAIVHWLMGESIRSSTRPWDGWRWGCCRRWLTCFSAPGTGTCWRLGRSGPPPAVSPCHACCWRAISSARLQRDR